MPDPQRKLNRRDRLRQLKLGPFAQAYDTVDNEAVRLLAELDQIPRKRGRLEAGQTTQSQVSGSAMKLLKKCNELEFPPPKSLIDLIAKIVPPAPSRPALSPKQLKAAKLDAKSIVEEKPPRSAGQVSIAISRDANKDRQNVHNWRRKAAYQTAVKEAVLELYVDKFSRPIDQEDGENGESL